MAAQFFLKFLAVIYFIAFWSLCTQIIGLIGKEGILPAGDFLADARQAWGQAAFWKVPTLCWFNHSDGFLLFLCGAGMVFSVGLATGILPWLNALILWVVYLSLTVVSQDFLGFQWDNLLLEVGFLSIFLYPARCAWQPCSEGPSKIVVWLFRWLLVRFMLESGFVKLASGDPTWRDLSALTYHYLTQPLPNVFSWYVHQMPAWAHQACCGAMFAIELAAPVLVFFGGRARFVAFVAEVSLQLVILLTGNYCFFNFLTIALCVLLLDDGQFKKIFFFIPHRNTVFSAKLTWGHKLVTAAIVALVLYVNVLQLSLLVRRPLPQPAYKILTYIEPFRSLNTYGLFAVMTTVRGEIVIEGSDDAAIWLPYEFRWKPGDVSQSPRWAQPHQPRWDWQMWFAALGDYRQSPWLANAMGRMLQGSKPVLDLLEKNPFPDKPPKYMRAVFYEYRFTDFAGRRATGDWWGRTYKGQFTPVMHLK